MAEISIFLVNGLPCHRPHLKELKGDVMVINRAVLYFDFKAHALSVRTRSFRVNDNLRIRNPRKSMRPDVFRVRTSHGKETGDASGQAGRPAHKRRI